MLALYDLMEDKVVQKYITFSNIISCEQLSLMIPIPKTTWFWVFDHLCFHPLRTMWLLNLLLIILKIKKVEMYGSLILLVICNLTQFSGVHLSVLVPSASNDAISLMTVSKNSVKNWSFFFLRPCCKMIILCYFNS